MLSVTAESTPYDLQEGDIIFTKDKVVGVCEHVAIYVGDDMIVQAVPFEGVEMLPLSELADDWAFRWFGGIGEIYRVNASNDVRTAVAEYAKAQIGKPWIWPCSRWSTWCTYCFKLTWQSWYVGSNGQIDVDPCGSFIYSWDLIDSPYTYKIYN